MYENCSIEYQLSDYFSCKWGYHDCWMIFHLQILSTAKLAHQELPHTDFYSSHYALAKHS